jgi:putative transposase
MDDYESLSHSKWECKYHVMFIPKCRRKTLYVELRRHLGEVFRKLARVYGEKKRNFVGQHFWARGYFVST